MFQKINAYPLEQIEEAYSYASARIKLMPLAEQVKILKNIGKRSMLDDIAQEYLNSLVKVFMWKDKGQPEYDDNK